jgi:hypothetical protein
MRPYRASQSASRAVTGQNVDKAKTRVFNLYYILSNNRKEVVLMGFMSFIDAFRGQCSFLVKNGSTGWKCKLSGETFYDYQDVTKGCKSGSYCVACPHWQKYYNK